MHFQEHIHTRQKRQTHTQIGPRIPHHLAETALRFCQPLQPAPSCLQAPAAIRVALSFGEVVRRGVARKRSPYPFGMGYIRQIQEHVFPIV